MIIPGKEYLVPTVGGIPVVLPSHVDQGNGEATGCHYHVDHRFGKGLFKIEDIDDDFRLKHCLLNDTVSPIVFDDGRPVEWKKVEDVHEWTPSGKLFTSTCWLYLNLGTKSAKDNRCVHHSTKLHNENDGLVCPAHGMRFKTDGSPRYVSPFWVCVDNQRALLESDNINFTGLEGNMKDKIFRLEDDNGEVIATDESERILEKDIPVRSDDTLKINMRFWSPSPCLKLKSYESESTTCSNC